MSPALRLVAACCLATFLSACATAPDTTSAAAEAKLKAEAQQALAQAEADAEAAAKASALWLPAENALLAARAAADAGDNLTVLELAKRVSEMCRLGMAQMGFPSTERR